MTVSSSKRSYHVKLLKLREILGDARRLVREHHAAEAIAKIEEAMGMVAAERRVMADYSERSRLRTGKIKTVKSNMRSKHASAVTEAG